MHTIVFKATFDSVSQISAVIAEKDNLYKALEEQCSTLFNLCEPLQFSVVDNQGNKVVMGKTCTEITNAQEPIVNILVEKTPMTLVEDKQSDDTVEETIPLTKQERLPKRAEAKKLHLAAKELRRGEKSKKQYHHQKRWLREKDHKVEKDETHPEKREWMEEPPVYGTTQNQTPMLGYQLPL